MKIVLATGIYPPDIGGPATYVRALAEEFVKRGVEVRVVTYGEMRKCPPGPAVRPPDRCPPGGRTGRAGTGENTEMQQWSVVRVPKTGGPFLRWWRYAKALKEHANDADAVIAFSSVSCGVPVWLAKKKGVRNLFRRVPDTFPRTLLRLGGDFFWERYTDRRGSRNLWEFYEHKIFQYTSILISPILRSFHLLIFSTRLQEEIYEKHYKRLPKHSVIENAIPDGSPKLHNKHEPFRLLFLGRFVGFKNLPTLVRAVAAIRESPLRRNVTLTFVGDGPMRSDLEALVRSLKLQGWVRFLPPTHGEEKKKYFGDYDLLVLPSLTELSPNVALEARASGLPVLLSSETGLSERLREGMVVRPLRSEDQIVQAILEAMTNYAKIAQATANSPVSRSWGEVTEEFLKLIQVLS